jgi:uncharacterized protein (DUF58 family)
VDGQPKGSGAGRDAAWAGTVLDAVRGVLWQAQRRVLPGVIGAHRSRRLGAGVEFSEYRAYRPGDDPRRIDWKLLARSDRVYVRQAEDQALLPTTILVDGSASRAYPVDSKAKWMLARSLTVGLASVAHTSGDPVGVTVVAGEHVVADIAPTTRRGVSAIIAAALGGIVPGITRGSGYRRALGAVGTRGRVVIIGDFLQGAGELLGRMRRVLGSGGEVYAVHVVAREELEPPTQTLLVSDPEDPLVRRPLLGETRLAYLEAFGAWRESLRQEWQGAGAVYVMVTTDEFAAPAVRRIVRS